ncbi:DUF3027 domain-containing protein [Gordonia sp. DT30]|uniref:DUF3027 domain-containing protein n=1 Tax=Gordonia sp. DT30 TaxID=3416546 RepID=UPI003CE7D10F
MDGTRLLDAVEVARGALVEDGHEPGAHRQAVAEGEWAAAHYFDSDLPGYRGWQWCVVVAGAPGTDVVTVSEVVLLPGEGALLAPEWLPWSDRVAPGDLSVGDMLAAGPDDPRLVPNHIDTSTAVVPGVADEYPADGVEASAPDPEDLAEVAGALGLGRKRLLSREGRDAAAQRWYDGEHGPGAEMAVAAPFPCCTCGFYIPLSGALRVAFGACANEYSADAQVVSAEYGCGAHSDIVAPSGEGSPAYDAFDDGVLEIVAVGAGSGGESDAQS